MSDKPNDNVVSLTKVVQFLPDDAKRKALLDPEQCVELLNSFAGNVQNFAQYFVAQDKDEQQKVMFVAENLMSESHLYGQWKAAIKANHVTRLRALQIKALDELEGDTLCPRCSDVSAIKGDKYTDRLAFAKLVLNDFIAGQVQQAKARESTSAQSSSVVHAEDADEDEALERARNA